MKLAFPFKINYVIISTNRVKVLIIQVNNPAASGGVCDPCGSCQMNVQAHPSGSLSAGIIYERICNMSASRKEKDRDNTQSSRRKRVNRFKAMIVIGAVVLICTSVLLNIVLVFKVLHLENEIDKLYSQTPAVVTQNNIYLD